MNFWLVCLPRADMEHCIKVGTFGLGRKHVISKVKAGDSVACVATKEKPWRLIGLGQVTSDYYIDDKQIFAKPGSFFDRFDLKAARLNPEPSLNDAMNELSFIKKIEHWPAYFKTGIVKMSQSDWTLLEKIAQTKH